MDCFYRSHLAFICIFIWSLAIFRTTDTGSITWHEPPPSETVIDTAITSTAETNLTKGSFNEELSCNFSLTADLSFETVSFEFDGVTVASYVKGRYPTMADRFVSRFNVTWVPSKLTLIVFKVTSDDKRKYHCRVQGYSSSHGLQAWLRIIKVDLLVQTQITNVTGKTVTEGGNVTLKCLAEGNPTPTVMWTRLSDHSVVTMPLTNIRRQNASVGYRCTANNGVKSPATRDVFLDVQYKPDHVSLNMSITNKVCTGMAVTFTCSAGAAKPTIQNYTLYKFVAGLTYISSNQFGIFNQTLETGGQHIYRCEARNSPGYTSSSNRTLEVHVPASVKIENDTIVVLEGRNVTLYCFSSGFPSPNVSWLDNTVKEGSILKLLNISRHRNGSYICLATNACGSDWGKVDINVQYPTEATGPGENATVAEGAVKLFTCSVDGNPEPGIEWYSENNGRILSNGKQLEASESGCYTCVASNNIGPPVNITHCLAIINASLTSVPPSIVSPGGAVEAKVMIVRDYSDFYRNLDSGPSKKFVAWFVQEMDKIYMNMPEYNWTLVTGLRPGSVIVHFILHFKTDVTREKGLKNLWVAISSNGTFGGIEAEYVSDESATSHTPASPKPAVSASPPWTIVGAVAGGVVLVAILVGVLIWWVHKQRKCRKDTKNEVRNSDLGRQDDEGGYSQVPGAYAQSGPPAANGTNGAAAEQQLEGATAIPNYAVVDKSKKKKKLREEVPPVYAEVDKSKKKKKKIDDKNLYETLDEPKKVKIPGELLYADLGDFQNRAVSTVSISPQPLPAIKKPEAYERTDYADIAQFLKGNTTSPQNGGNEDTEWKPERPSKKKIQGKDNETPI